MKEYSRKRIKEQTILFIDVLKWTVIAVIIGVIAGFSTGIFLKLLDWGTLAAHRIDFYFLFLPLAFIASALLVKYLAPDAEGHGTEKVIEALHKNNGNIRASVVPVKLVATIITLVFGGSAGKEGPCAQIGAGLASIFAGIFRFNNTDKKKIVICGLSAGFASVFGTPIAGAIFGVEVLFVGSLQYEVMLPSFIAGIVSFQVTKGMGIEYLYHTLSFIPKFSNNFFIEIIFAGVVVGLCSFLFIEIVKLGHYAAKRIKSGVVIKAFLAGSILAVFGYFLTDRYLGLGLESIHYYLSGGVPDWHAFFTKSFLTSVTLNFGGSGGIVTPIFFTGSAAGALYASMFGLDVATFAAIGMVAMLAGAANTPIAASIMAVEFFGPAIAPYAALACVISFLMTGHRSVYSSQILSMKKSTLISSSVGSEMKDVKDKVNVNIDGKSLKTDIKKKIGSIFKRQ